MFVLKRRNILIISVLILTILTLSICFGAISKSSGDKVEAKVFKVVVDAGHGGVDGGVVGVKTGVLESELNLIIAKKLEKYLVNGGFSVELTRKTDAGLYGMASGNLKKKDMEKRKEIIHEEKPNLVVSIHMNKYSLSSRRGAQVFYKDGDNYGKLLATSIQNNLNDMPESIREYSPLCGDYYILNCSNVPSVITECGFLSNPEDEALLTMDEYQEKIAYTIYKGIVEYFSQSTSKY